MKKRISPFIVAIPAFVLFALFKLWPFVLSIIMSFQNFSPSNGITGSEFVGLDNYRMVSLDQSFASLIGNSFYLTLLPAISTALLAFFVSYLIIKIPKRRIRLLILCILAIPALLPAFILIDRIKAIAKTNSLHPTIPTVIEPLKYMFFPITYGVLSIERVKNNRTGYLLRLSLAYLLIRFAFMLTDVELLWRIQIPMDEQFIDTPGLLSYRIGIHGEQYSYSATLDVMRTVLQMLINIPLVIGLKKLLFSEKQEEKPSLQNGEAVKTNPVIPIILTLFIVIAFVVTWIICGISIAIGALVFVCMSVLFAYPLTTKSKLYPIILFLMIAINCTTAEAIFQESIGITLTGFQSAIIIGVSLLGALIMFLFSRTRFGRTHPNLNLKEYIRKNRLATALVILVGFSLAFNFVYGRSANDYHIFKVHVDTRFIKVAKPVIYLYPESKTDVYVSLDFDGELTFTYPSYQDGWRVTAYPDGKILDSDGKEYSYLFWEGISDMQYDFSRGFLVSGHEVVEFLQEKLSYMGLTPEEYNEFIVYWAPLLQENEYNLIAFQDEEYTKAAELIITPQPDSVLRIYMAAKPLDTPVNIEEQHLQPFERVGFTVVEWGGTIMR